MKSDDGSSSQSEDFFSLTKSQIFSSFSLQIEGQKFNKLFLWYVCKNEPETV